MPIVIKYYRIHFLLKLLLILVFCVGCSYQFQAKTDLLYKEYKLDKITDKLYLEGRIFIKTNKGSLLGNGKLFITEEFTFFALNDAFYNPVFKFYIDDVKIKIKEKNILRELENNQKNREKIIFNLENLEFQSVFWGRKISAVKNLDFYFKDNKPNKVVKKKSLLTVNYLNWKNEKTIALPSQLVIISEKPKLEIKFFVKKHSINPTNFTLTDF